MMFIKYQHMVSNRAGDLSVKVEELKSIVDKSAFSKLHYG